jgi:hypothetical protein
MNRKVDAVRTLFGRALTQLAEICVIVRIKTSQASVRSASCEPASILFCRKSQRRMVLSCCGVHKVN